MIHTIHDYTVRDHFIKDFGTFAARLCKIHSLNISNKTSSPQSCLIYRLTDSAPLRRRKGIKFY